MRKYNVKWTFDLAERLSFDGFRDINGFREIYLETILKHQKLTT